MFRRYFVWLAAFVLVTSASAAASAADPVVLKIGTLAPADSTWGRVFKVWQKGFSERTSGAVTIQFFWNGQQGDEISMVGKIRTGQLDGAAITAVGLGQIYKQVLVLQLPGVFTSWDKLDAARNKMKGQFDAEFEKAGFKNLGWGDVGAAHNMSKGFEVRTPKDLKRKGVFYEKGDPIAPMIYQLIGDITPKELGVPEITAALTSGAVNVVDAPPLAAEQLQWAPQLDHINRMVDGYAIGALVFSSTKFKSLPADVQTALVETGGVSANALTKSIRAADDAAYLRLAGDPAKGVKGRMTDYTTTPAENAEWAKLFADARAKLKAGTFNAETVDAVEAAAK